MYANNKYTENGKKLFEMNILEVQYGDRYDPI